MAFDGTCVCAYAEREKDGGCPVCSPVPPAPASHNSGRHRLFEFWRGLELEHSRVCRTYRQKLLGPIRFKKQIIEHVRKADQANYYKHHFDPR
ncbi:MULTISPECIES: hypothetical protein [Henriciella]|jgi:hypothetical protein|uniref:Uncharacterized protein n=1 Tax=Henriciella pelagia TaxID=1977912 RepID=A0ABQ1JT65_9PROT|nr:hypothetical protein [Henriciella pelagia]GGB77055.1 hypothetical protein GCM10011503_27270 [Henriciella pelagia]